MPPPIWTLVFIIQQLAVAPQLLKSCVTPHHTHSFLSKLLLWPLTWSLPPDTQSSEVRLMTQLTASECAGSYCTTWDAGAPSAASLPALQSDTQEMASIYTCTHTPHRLETDFLKATKQFRAIFDWRRLTGCTVDIRGTFSHIQLLPTTSLSMDQFYTLEINNMLSIYDLKWQHCCSTGQYK